MSISKESSRINIISIYACLHLAKIMISAELYNFYH